MQTQAGITQSIRIKLSKKQSAIITSIRIHPKSRRNHEIHQDQFKHKQESQHPPEPIYKGSGIITSIRIKLETIRNHKIN